MHGGRMPRPPLGISFAEYVPLRCDGEPIEGDLQLSLRPSQQTADVQSRGTCVQRRPSTMRLDRHIAPATSTGPRRRTPSVMTASRIIDEYDLIRLTDPSSTQPAITALPGPTAVRSANCSATARGRAAQGRRQAGSPPARRVARLSPIAPTPAPSGRVAVIDLVAPARSPAEVTHRAAIAVREDFRVAADRRETAIASGGIDRPQAPRR